MYCPDCGQQQTSSETRFCSRCGFPLAGVARLLASRGILTELQATEASDEKRLSPKRRGVRLGVLMMFIGFVLTPLIAILSAEINFPIIFVPLSAVFFIFGGLLRILYAAIFEEGRPKQSSLPAVPPYLPPTEGEARRFAPPSSIYDYNALPPAKSIPVNHFNPTSRANTGELVSPPSSVTEHTTRLLDNLAQDKPLRDDRSGETETKT